MGGHLLQVSEAPEERDPAGIELLQGVCDELDRRGIIAVEAYPEGVPDPWLPSPGPTSVYEAAGLEHVAGDERFPVYRRELTGETMPTPGPTSAASSRTRATTGRSRCRRRAIPTTCSGFP